MDEGFSMYAGMEEVLFREVQELVNHFFVTCNDEASISADKSVTYREGQISAVTFLGWGRGVTL